MQSSSQSTTKKDPESGDDVVFLRTDDDICLSAAVIGPDPTSLEPQRGWLSACGFGSAVCEFELQSNKDLPVNLNHCCFTLEHAYSVRALQEMISTGSFKESTSRKTLLYGHAVLLRHKSSQMYLSCLSTSPCNDKLAFHVGLSEKPEEEACWFTVHPSSKQRSEGEKVRGGDDVILVSILTERYLTVERDFVQLSFQQTFWVIQPVGCGRMSTIRKGYLRGGNVVRFFHHHTNECLTAPKETVGIAGTFAHFESGSMDKHARSLWQIEALKTRWGYGFIQWGHPVRIKSIVSGRYLTLGVGNNMKLVANPERDDSTFFARRSEDDSQFSDEAGMGEPAISFGNSVVFLQHRSSFWLGQQIQTAAIKRQKVSRRGKYTKAMGMVEWHMNFGFMLTRAGEEEVRAADVMRISTRVMLGFPSISKKASGSSSKEITEKMRQIHSIQDGLLKYFSQPDPNDGYDLQQSQLKVVRMRQDLFREQGMTSLLLETTEQLERLRKLWTGDWCEDLLNVIVKMYSLLAAVIKGNSINCSQFAYPKCLDWLFEKLCTSHGQASKGVLCVLHCILADSPEVLNMITANHIQSMVAFLEKSGRDEKVLEALSALCVCNGVAVRDNQNLICSHLLPKNLILRTRLVHHIESVRANIFVGIREGAALYPRWYYEVSVDDCPSPADTGGDVSYDPESAFLRIGWGNSSGFRPFLGGNGSRSLGAVGDDLHSYAFDGRKIWCGGQCQEAMVVTEKRRVIQKSKSIDREYPERPCELSLDVARLVTGTGLRVGDFIGCLLDLQQQVIRFTLNGQRVKGEIAIGDMSAVFFPVISMSAGISCSFHFGANLGPYLNSCSSSPEGYAGLYEAFEGTKVLIEKCVSLGDAKLGLTKGLPALMDFSGYVPAPVDTSDVELPSCVELVRDQLAENIHEVWAVQKIEAGFSYGPTRDDEKKHNPCLVPFNALSEQEKFYDVDMAFQTLKTLLALGYQIGLDGTEHKTIHKLKLPPEKYKMSNDYIPQPLDLSVIPSLPHHLGVLVDLLAKNAHDVWARSRVGEGWTYGKAKDGDKKRNPLLLPYEKLSKEAKDSNRATAHESVRTLVAYGFTLIPPPDSDLNIGISVRDLSRELSSADSVCRTFRGQYNCGVSTGKWYYEVTVKTDGYARVGWATLDFQAGIQLGNDENSYSFDGYLARKWHGESDSFGKTWTDYDTVGCLLNLKEKKIEFTLNGNLLVDGAGNHEAFVGLPDEAFVPAVTLGEGQAATLNFGHDLKSLRYYNQYGLQEGYEPFCSNTTNCLPLWYSRNLPIFQDIETDHLSLETDRINADSRGGGGRGDSSRVNTITVTKKTTTQKVRKWEYLRLNISIQCGHSEIEEQGSIGDIVSTGLNEKAGSSEDEDGGSNGHGGRYGFSVRVFPGQIPSDVEIGWVTPTFHSKSVRGKQAYRPSHYSAELVSGEKRVSVRSAYIHKLSSLHACLGDRPLSRDVVVTCILDSEKKAIFFKINGKDVSKFSLKVQPGSVLFPAFFALTSCQSLVQFEFTPEEGYDPLIAAVVEKESSFVDPCPPRIRVQSLEDCTWACLPSSEFSLTVKRSPDGSAMVKCNETAQSVVAIMQEQERVLDILELVENPELMRFHAATLSLYSLLCSHGNLLLGHIISQLVDNCQLMKCVESSSLPGILRQRFFNLVVSLHFATHSSARLLTKNEFIVPLSEIGRPIQPTSRKFSLQTVQRETLQTELKSPIYDAMIIPEGANTCLEYAEADVNFPVVELKKHVFEQLRNGLTEASLYRRDLDQQAMIDYFVPLLRVLDHLLIIGLLSADELHEILVAFDPVAFGSGSESWNGLIAVGTQEPIKLEVARLLQHLCDCQLRRKIERIVEYAREFVASVQKEQEKRLSSVSDESPSILARKTREFRRPPSEQMTLVLDSLKSNVDLSPANSHLATSLNNFQTDFLSRCAIPDVLKQCFSCLEMGEQGVTELTEDLLREGDAGNGLGGTFCLRDFIAKTMVQWSQQGLQDPDLIREVFSLLHRQYDGVGEVYRGLVKTYVVKDTGAGEILKVMDALGSVLSLLQVRMGPKEEEILRDGLRDIGNSVMFFQHPDLMRSLGVHDAVTALLRNTVGADVLLTSQRRSRMPLTLMKKKEGSQTIVVACCKFLINFCRASRQNQRAVFDQLEFLLRHSTSTCIALKGSCCLCVATAAVKDSQENALALKESHIDRVVYLLSAAAMGLPASTGNPRENAWPETKRLSRAESSISLEEWSPRECEHYLDFLRNIIWVNGSTVEENAGLVVRGLIRRPECLGPALDADGQGIYEAFKEAVVEAERNFEKRLKVVKGYETGVTNQEGVEKLTVEEDEKQEDEGSDDVDQRRRHSPSTVSFPEESFDSEDGSPELEMSPLTELPDFGQISLRQLGALPSQLLLHRQSTTDSLVGILPPSVASTPRSTTEGISSSLPNDNIPSGFRRYSFSSPSEVRYHPEELMGFETMSRKVKRAKETMQPPFETMFDDEKKTQSPPEDSLRSHGGKEDRGAAALSFYANLIDLLGHCACVKNDGSGGDLLYETRAMKKDKLNTSTRINTILKSLIPLDELVNILTIPFNIPVVEDRFLAKRFVGIQPHHKAATLLFLQRVYGLGEQSQMVELLEKSFLPDMRLATRVGLNSVISPDCDCFLALNRYIFSSVLPLLTANAVLFHGSKHTPVIDALLHTCYNLAKSEWLGSQQRQKVSDFLVAFTHELNPSVMQRLMRKLVRDVKNVTENALVALRVIHLHYVHFKRYYGVAGSRGDRGWNGVQGSATSEEKHLTMTTFAILIDTLHKRALLDDDEIFRRGMECLGAVACALAPEYTLHRRFYSQLQRTSSDKDDSSSRSPSPSPPAQWLPEHLKLNADRYAEYAHDKWSYLMILDGWTGDEAEDDAVEQKVHPLIKPFGVLDSEYQEAYKQDVLLCLEALICWGWDISHVDPEGAVEQARQLSMSSASIDIDDKYNPQPFDFSNIALTKEMDGLTERLAECLCENHAARGIPSEGKGFSVVVGEPVDGHYDMLLEKDKLKYRESASDVLRYLLLCGYRIRRIEDIETMAISASQALDRRFSYWLLQWILNVMEQCVRDLSFNSTAVFGPKVLMPLLRDYLETHYEYFASDRGRGKGRTLASREEKALIVSLFCVSSLSAKNNRVRFDSIKAHEQVCRVIRSVVRALDVGFMCEYVSPDIERQWQQHSRQLEADMNDCLELDMQHFVFRISLPVVTSLYSHLARNNGSKIMTEYLTTNEALIGRLWSLGNSFLPEPSCYKVVGEALGAMALAMPTAFLENKNTTDEIPTLSSLLRMLVEIDDKLNGDHRSACTDCVGKKLSEGLTGMPERLAVVLPFLCSYVSEWWVKGPSALCLRPGSVYDSYVDSPLVDSIIGHILSIISTQFARLKADWICTTTSTALPLIPYCTIDLLSGHFMPLLETLLETARILLKKGEHIAEEVSPIEAETRISRHYEVLVRDLSSILILVIKVVENHKDDLQTRPEETMKLFSIVGCLFHCWYKSPHFRREYQAFLVADDGNRSGKGAHSHGPPSLATLFKRTKSSGSTSADCCHHTCPTGKAAAENAIANCLKKLVPVVMQGLSDREQRLVQEGQAKMLSQHASEEELYDYIEMVLGSSKRLIVWESAAQKNQTAELQKQKEKVYVIIRVLFQLHNVEHPSHCKTSVWKRVLTQQKKKAVMKCFLMIPLYRIPLHRAVNLFLPSYGELFLKDHVNNHIKLMDHLTNLNSSETVQTSAAIKPPAEIRLVRSVTHSKQQLQSQQQQQPSSRIDSLQQLVEYFTRAAAGEQMSGSDPLYVSYAEIMSQSCGPEEEDENDCDEKSYQEQEMEKRHLLKHQGNLLRRGAAEMVVMLLSECSGSVSQVTQRSLQLGIALLRGGNSDVQTVMLNYLKSKSDVGFFNSMASLIASCGVLDLDTYERHNKAEILGIDKANSGGIKVLNDAPFTISLFRFLQLLCEGHNTAFQNILRTQAGNITTVNIVICTVDYLLRLQESISDFYWHYSAQHMIDAKGRANFTRAARVAKQVFRTLTEYIQGPCVENQVTLAYSRLWDAVGGFLHVFAKIMSRLSKDVSQLELLRELLRLQKDMVIMLLGLLEGNEHSTVVGKQMVDTLEECSCYLEEILQFFNMFIRLNDFITSAAFKEYDRNKDGWISAKEFEQAMLSQSMYSKEEIRQLMDCADVNKDGRLDYMEFTERFYMPAGDIGFSYAMLLTNLSEHLPNDLRVKIFKEKWKRFLRHFDPCLGRIEILGKNGKIERVYFEIKRARQSQWEEPQIQASKHHFLHSVTRASHKEKLKEFVSFCEDAIFEMQHAASISDTEEQQRLVRAEMLIEKHQAVLDEGTSLGLERDPLFRSTNWCLSWIKFLFYLPVLLSVAFGKAVWKRVHVIDVSSLSLERNEEPTANVDSEPMPISRSNSFTNKTSSLRRRRSSSIPTTSTPGKYFPNSSGQLEERPSSVLPTVDEADSRQNEGSTAPADAPKITLRRPDSERNLFPSQSLNDNDRLNPKRVLGRSISEPMGAVAEKEVDVRRDSFDLSIPSGFLGADAPRARPTILKRDGSSRDGTPRLAADPINAQSKDLGRQFSYEKSAALIANQRRLSLILLEAETEVDGKAGLKQREKVEQKPVDPPKQPPKRSFSVEEPVTTEESMPYIPKVALAKRKFLVMFSRSYYVLKSVALVLVFLVNFLLLFYKVSPLSPEANHPFVFGSYEALLFYGLKLLGLAHLFISISILIGYAHLKVPLVIFKMEKHVARQLEFQGAWITNSPTTWSGYWHQLVIKSRSFPLNYWDKMVKQRVLTRYQFTVSRSKLCAMLNIDDETDDQATLSRMGDFDWRYWLWVLGVVFSDKSFLYNLVYLLFSALANWNYFFFCTHLLDVVVGFKTLQAVLQSVTHNAKQLLLTLMMTLVVVYIYTVLAFNFFRKFYVKEVNGGTIDPKCNDMLTCFLFHLHAGLRAGGGIGDEITGADGDEYEMYRIIFDITFFFFVIVILLAIVQGLIIDSFGEIRDKAEGVQIEMETKCFICGVSKEQFDKTPHGFERHLEQEHSMANYMFFLMYLINKQETEFTGQESYVWKLYLERSLDFFPVGDCFRFSQERQATQTPSLQTSITNEINEI